MVHKILKGTVHHNLTIRYKLDYVIYGHWGIAFIIQIFFKTYKKHLFGLERPLRILQQFP